MAINPTTVLRHVKRKLGASHKPLPLGDEDILDTIYEETLYTFSNYFPLMWKVVVDGTKDNVLGELGVYTLKTDGLEILGVAKMMRGEGFVNGSLYPQIRSNNIFDMQMGADIGSMIEIPDTFQFIPPNRVEVFPKYVSNRNILFVVKCIHPRHLGTIPLAMRDQFFRLCELDVKVSLFPILKNYDQLNTAFGNIDLKIDDLERAEDERKELLDIWDTQYLKEAGRKRLYIY